MADRRALKTLAASMERRAKELLDCLKLPETTHRVVKSKTDKLRTDVVTLDELIGRCASVSDVASEEVLKKQQDVLDIVEPALEGADEFLAEKEFKKDISNKELEVECVCQSVSSRIEQFKTRAAKLSLNEETEVVMSTELDKLDDMVKDGIEKIKFLFLNDVANKEKYQTDRSKLDELSGEIVDSRLLLVRKSESEIDEKKLSSADNYTDQAKGFVEVTNSGSKPQEVSSSVPQSGHTHSGQLTGPALSTAQGGQSMPLLQTGYAAMSTPMVTMPAPTVYQGTNAPTSGNTFGYYGNNPVSSYAQQMATSGFYIHPGQHYLSSGYRASISGGMVNPPYVTSGYDRQNFNQQMGLPKVQIQKIKPPIFDRDISKCPAWKKRWKELISPGSTSDCEELYRMQDAMGPKLLAETIKSFQTLAEAWAYLEDQYGRADVAAVKLINDFKNLSLGKLSDHEKFMEMYKHFRVLSTHLNEIGQLNALNSLTEFNLVIAKLPGDIKTRYAEFKSRHNYLNGFALLNFFMDEQAKVSRECCVTLQATSVTNDKAAVKCFNCSESGHISKNCPTQKNKGQLRINGLSAKSLACGLCQVPHKVEEGKNKGKFKTRLSACDQFRSLSVNERAQVLADVEGCIKCTDWQHSSKNCDAVYGKRKWQPCSVKDGNGSSKCGKDHHNLLHGANHAYVCKIKACPVYDNSCSGIDPPELKDGFCGQTVSNKDNCEVLLIIQNIPVVSSPNKTLESLVFFDKGATIGLIRNLFAKRLNLTGKSVKKMVQVVGQSWSVWETMEYVVSLVDRFGKKHLLCLYGIDSITSPIQKVNIDGIMHKFPDTRALDVARPIGQVDILVGIDKLSLHPKQVLNVGDLGLFQSLFGTGWILAGTDKDLRSSAVAFDKKSP